MGHHDRQQSGGVALEMNQLHHLRLRNKHLCKTELHTNTPVLRHCWSNVSIVCTVYNYRHEECNLNMYLD